jgi:signal transduction histidine kinase
MLSLLQSLREKKSGRACSQGKGIESTVPRRACWDAASLRYQETIFGVLNLFVIATLLFVHTAFTSYLGPLRLPVAITLLAGIIVQVAEIIWLQAQTSPATRAALRTITWWSIGFNTVLTLVLMILTRGEDSQSFILMAVPVVESAFRLGLAGTIGVIALANLLNFFEASNLGSIDEYLEAGATSLIYLLVGVVVWLLVNNLRRHQDALRINLGELERTRERLLTEAKLAAVGRLSSAIAHEIRNPVAMIASSLATANQPDHAELTRKEMFAIATAEAERLERLTSDFLSYARPRAPQITPADIADTLNYVAAAARAHAEKKGVLVRAQADSALEGNFDPSQIHQGLLNLVLKCN